MGEPPITAAATFCATVVDEWARAGLAHAVVAPGSRSTPLALALADDERFTLHVHHDERSAAFVALGLAQATGRAVPVVTTSGTAAVELHPSVVEAHHARVPLICATADRPPELRDVGAPQAIDQTHLFGRSVRWFADPGVPEHTTSATWRSLAARAVIEAEGSPAGPVHLNLPFRDPLVGRAGELPPARSERRPWHARLDEPRPAGASTIDALVDALDEAEGVILAGSPGSGRVLDAEAVHALARALGWPVLADPRSGCRVPEGTTISHADALLRSEAFTAAHRPRVVLQLGDRPASKVVGQWLTGSSARLVVATGEGALADPDHLADTVVAADPSAVARDLAARLRGRVDGDHWIESWAAADAAAGQAIASVLAGHPEPTEPGVARDLCAALGDGTQLVVSSSMPIRDVEWYAGPRRGLVVRSNRGANGIDGVVSTAVGVALAGSPAALLVGDVALLHDTNGLLGAAERGIDLVVVVVDNDGGGIFSFLPQAATLTAPRFELLFGTPHGVDLVALLAVHGVEAHVIERQSELGPAVTRAQTLGGVRAICVRTDRTTNVKVHDELHDAVGAALGGPGA